MDICFVLPGRAAGNVGGYKVLYTYAAGMADKGHRVTLLHTPFLTPASGFLDKTKQTIKNTLVYRLAQLNLIHWRPEQSLLDHPNIHVVWQPTPQHYFKHQKADVTIISFWTTASWLTNETNPNVGKKVYLLQEYEYYQSWEPEQQQWMNQQVLSAADIHFCTISPALTEMVLSNNSKASLSSTPNGIELEHFFLTTPIEERHPTRIGFPFRHESFKGTTHCIELLEKLKSRVDIEVWSFGPADGKQQVPSWMEYYERPSRQKLRELFNSTAAFAVPSSYEGWGLPGSEAMACGAALVAYDNGGVRAYAEHNNNALIAPANDQDTFFQYLLEMAENCDLRIKLAREGHSSIQQFTWEAAIDRFERVLIGQ